MLSIFSVKNFRCPHAGAHAVLYDLLFFMIEFCQINIRYCLYF